MRFRILFRLGVFCILCCAIAAAVTAYAQQSSDENVEASSNIEAPATQGAKSNANASDDATPQRKRAPRRTQNASSDAPFVRYTGELMQDSNSPLSGVFPITFELYENENDDTPIWREKHFVAVDLGAYTIDLGKRTAIPARNFKQQRWLAVNVDTLGELLREQITLREHTPKTSTAPKNIKNLSFAELADRAVTADRAHVAEDAQRLGGKTLEEIDRFGELQRQFVQLRARVNNIQAMGGTQVARRTSTSEAIGNGPGQHFRVQCPEGQVVVGITGRANDAIRNAQLICAPLEQTR